MTTATAERQAARDAPALRTSGRLRRPSPYLVVGGLFWLVMSVAYWRVPMCCDFGQHAAVVERLKANLLHPAHPMADLPGAGSPYYSPYAVLQAVFARATGLAGRVVVKLAGPVNLLVLLVGVGRFVRVLTPRPWAPVAALGAMVLLWGTHPAWWSGYLGLLSMTGNLAYPSTFAIGLAFLAWAWAGSLAARPTAGSLWRYAGLGALCGLILLIHPITAVGAVTGVVAFAVTGVGAFASPCRGPWPSRSLEWRVPCGWAVTAVAAAAVAASWPYFGVFSLIGDHSVDAIHQRLYAQIPGKFWLAGIGLPALWLRWRRNHRDPLVLMFVLECAVVAYGWVSGHFTYGRILGLTLVPPQFALAVEVAAPRPWPRWRRGLASVAAVGACVGFLSVQAGAVVPRSLDPVGLRHPPSWPTYEWAARHIAPGDVVLTNGYRAVRSLPAYGPNLVAPAWPDPALDERERDRRRAAVRAYLAPTSTHAERTAIVRRYHVRWLLLGEGQRVPGEAVVVARNARTGEVLARVDGDGSPYSTYSTTSSTGMLPRVALE
ncbi:hypothetical protein [Streptomyces jeddahensis]|uniref:Glycosyltransferase RgtA/B/C/D-like domain-containing protein n=1 Tax=Streptomyces jeddahensis TaxID=1716141 RepID=A0A177HIT4_9ACTN|nr:hypothetical protein [Streptomyces jeddahensis]OAH10088.1 hypothetical protein STSP_65950 [Streptomyces jeddahensis]